jgi:hypothetical protein
VRPHRNGLHAGSPSTTSSERSKNVIALVPIVWILCVFDTKLEALGGLWEFLKNQYDKMPCREVEALWGTLGNFEAIWGENRSRVPAIHS